MRHVFALTLLAAGLAAAGCQRQTPAKTTEPSGAPSTAAASSGTPANGNPAATANERTPREVTLPAGTRLPIVLDTSVGSKTSRAEDPVRAHLSSAVSHQGEVALPEGSLVSGVVTSAVRSGKVKGRAHVAIRFDTVTPPGGEAYKIDTSAVGRTAAATHKKDALEIGGPAVGGAIIGGLLGGKKGTLIGTVAGAGAGTAVVLSTRGREIGLARGAALTLELRAPITVRIR